MAWTAIGTGSLTTLAPAGIVTAGRPPKVIGWFEPGTSSAPLVRSPTYAAPITSGAVPNVFSRVTRTAVPASVGRVIIRTVAFVSVSVASPCWEDPQAAYHFAGLAASAAPTRPSANTAAKIVARTIHQERPRCRIATSCSWELRSVPGRGRAEKRGLRPSPARRRARPIGPPHVGAP